MIAAASIETSGTSGTAAIGTNKINITGMESGARYVHITVKGANTRYSNVLTVAMPYDYYYSEDFEAYNEDTNINSETLSPISQVHSGTGDANQKVVLQTENNVLSLSSRSSWASDQIVALDSTKLNSADKYILEGKVYVPDATTGWRARFGFANNGYSSEVGVHFKDGNIIYNYNDSTSILLSNYVSNRWYDIKIEVTPSTSKYSVYINNELKANDLTLTDGANNIALSSGHSYTTLYDDLRFYTMSASTPTVTPTAATTTVAKTAVTQASVAFALTNDPAYADAQTWKVYDTLTGGSEVSGVSASNAGNTLMLSHIADIPPGDYYVSVTEDGKSESTRLKLTVGAYVPPYVTITQTAVSVTNLNENAKLMLASYSSGRLIDIKIVPVSEGVNLTFSEAGLITHGADKIKVMLWKDTDNIRPLCGSADVSY